MLSAAPKLLAERIYEARKRLGFTQAELAERIGVGRETIWRIESGRAGEVGYGTVLAALEAVGYTLGVEYGIPGPREVPPGTFNVREWMRNEYLGGEVDAL